MNTTAPVNLRVNEITGYNVARNFDDIYRLYSRLRQDYEDLVLTGGGVAGGWTSAPPVVKLATITEKVGIGTVTPTAKLTITSITEQLRMEYNAANYFKTTVEATGKTIFAIASDNGTPTFEFTKRLDVVSLTEQMRLQYNAANYFKTTVSDTGKTTFAIGSDNGTPTFEMNKALTIKTTGTPFLKLLYDDIYAGAATFSVGSIGDGLVIASPTMAYINSASDARFAVGQSWSYCFQLWWHYNATPTLSYGEIQITGNRYLAFTGLAFTFSNVVGIGVASVDDIYAKLHVASTTTQLWIAYNYTNHLAVDVSSIGTTDFTITSSGGDPNFSFNKAIYISDSVPATKTYRLYNNGGTLSWNGAAIGGGGISSLNGLTGATQTFTNDTNVTIVSAGTAHVVTWSGTLAAARVGGLPGSQITSGTVAATYLPVASYSADGIVNQSAQTFAGLKTFQASGAHSIVVKSTAADAAIDLQAATSAKNAGMVTYVDTDAYWLVGQHASTSFAIYSYTFSGGGKDVLTIAPTTGAIATGSTTGAWSGSLTIYGITDSIGQHFYNPIDSTADVTTQDSPWLKLTAQGWDTTGTRNTEVPWYIRNEAYESPGYGGGCLVFKVESQYCRRPMAVDEQGRIVLGLGREHIDFRNEGYPSGGHNYMYGFGGEDLGDSSTSVGNWPIILAGDIAGLNRVVVGWPRYGITSDLFVSGKVRVGMSYGGGETLSSPCSISSGSATPTNGSDPDGSIYMKRGVGIYVAVSGAWVAVTIP